MMETLFPILPPYYMSPYTPQVSLPNATKHGSGVTLHALPISNHLSSTVGIRTRSPVISDPDK